MNTTERVLVGDVTVVFADDVDVAISSAAPGATVVVTQGQPDEVLRELGRYGAIVVTEDGQVMRPHG